MGAAKMAEAKAEVEELKKCLTGCSDQWEKTNNNVKAMQDQYDGLKQNADENRPLFKKSIEENDANSLTADLINVFIHHKKTSMGLERALRWNNCNIRDEAMEFMAMAHPDSDKEQVATAWKQILEDCPRLADEM